MVSAGCLKILFPLFTTVLFFRISRSPFHCALSASIVGSISHPVGDRPSHPICETALPSTGHHDFPHDEQRTWRRIDDSLPKIEQGSEDFQVGCSPVWAMRDNV